MSLRIANGPVSWGVDFADAPGIPSWETVFSEIGEAGYQWCELGPLGYLPDDDMRVRAELDARGLGVAGSYVFEPMENRARHDEICDTARRTSERIAALGGNYLVVIDLVGDERAATAGRPDAAPRLKNDAYRDLLDGLRAVSRVALDHKLTPVLHPHAGSWVEFEDEVEQVLADTESDGLELCIDTGHFAYAGIDPVAFLAQHRDRVQYLHFKDINPIVHQRVVNESIAFFDAVSLGVFCPLGRGAVDFNALAAQLKSGFDGPGTVEQDRDARLPTSPLDDARASLDYLRGLGI
ncbi:MAG: TIM barrel protein [Acidimicrobiales bacterium]